MNPHEMMIVEDVHKDERFKDNPLVTGEPYISFYAGVPLINEEGIALGSLCVIDQQSRQLTPMQANALQVLAKQVMAKLELRRKVLQLQEINEKLERAEK